MKSAAGKFETYYIDRKTGTAQKVLCGGVCGKDSSNSKMRKKFRLRKFITTKNPFTEYEY